MSSWSRKVGILLLELQDREQSEQQLVRLRDAYLLAPPRRLPNIGPGDPGFEGALSNCASSQESSFGTSILKTFFEALEQELASLYRAPVSHR